MAYSAILACSFGVNFVYVPLDVGLGELMDSITAVFASLIAPELRELESGELGFALLFTGLK